MKRSISRVLLIGFFGLFLITPDVWAVKFGRVTVDSVSLHETHEATRRGYAGYLFLVKNDDAKKHEIKITIPNHAYYSYGSSMSISSNSRRVELTPGQVAKVWIYQPAIPMSGNNAALVTIDGYPYNDRPVEVSIEHEPLDSVGGGYHRGYYSPPTPSSGTSYSHSDSTMSILASRGLTGNLRDQLKTSLGDCSMVLSAQKTEEWPTSWVGYSRFDGVLLTEKEFGTLSDETIAALADYISVGGAVWVRPEKKAPVKLSTPMKKLERAANVGLGLFYRDKSSVSSFKEHITKNISCVNNCIDSNMAADLLPALKRDATPVRLFLVLLIFYAMLIGPVLQFVLKRKRRRIWMLWIIPAVSVVLCVVVFIGSYLSEGFSGYANFRNITILDQTSGRASTIGWASFYSPLSDGAGLKFSTATVLQPQYNSSGYRGNEERRDVAIDWTNGQHLTSGWLQAKTPIVFRLWKAESRREKLTIRKDKSGKVTVTNALGADAEGLRVCMPDGQFYTAKKIPAGKTATLDKVGGADSAAISGSHLSSTVKDYCFNSSNWHLSDYEVVDKERVELKPGSYQVFLDGHPFVNTAITDPAKDQGKTLVFGQFVVEEK